MITVEYKTYSMLESEKKDVKCKGKILLSGWQNLTQSMQCPAVSIPVIFSTRIVQPAKVEVGIHGLDRAVLRGIVVVGFTTAPICVHSFFLTFHPNPNSWSTGIISSG